MTRAVTGVSVVSEFWVVKENEILYRSVFRSAGEQFICTFGGGELWICQRATKNVTLKTSRKRKHRMS